MVYFIIPGIVLLLLCLLDTVESVTPNNVRDIRMFLNGSAMDVMYYTSPLYRTEVSSFDSFVNIFISALQRTVFPGLFMWWCLITYICV